MKLITRIKDKGKKINDKYYEFFNWTWTYVDIATKDINKTNDPRLGLSALGRQDAQPHLKIAGGSGGGKRTHRTRKPKKHHKKSNKNNKKHHKKTHKKH
tara:strand:+ start:52 stop:348 length:297 start_codon:yes stop_codon:yes gene_type:complete